EAEHGDARSTEECQPGRGEEKERGGGAKKGNERLGPTPAIPSEREPGDETCKHEVAAHNQDPASFSIHCLLEKICLGGEDDGENADPRRANQLDDDKRGKEGQNNRAVMRYARGPLLGRIPDAHRSLSRKVGGNPCAGAKRTTQNGIREG